MLKLRQKKKIELKLRVCKKEKKILNSNKNGEKS